MKINIEVDCTPAEARNFLGLPDVKPMQDHLLKDVEDRMRATMEAMDAKAFFERWLPSQMQGFEKLQQTFWSQMMGGRDATE